MGRVVIVDYGLGNLFSVVRALQFLGVAFIVSGEIEDVCNAERLILPGVGAFGEGMNQLEKRGLIEPIISYAQSGRPLLGICLGMQLLMTEGEEFGVHRGLDIVMGKARPLRSLAVRDGCKIPHIGWNSMMIPSGCKRNQPDGLWSDTALSGLAPGSFMYFVHSNVVILANDEECLAETGYGGVRFCSVLRKGNVYGCQFHPERSGPRGLAIYKNFATGMSALSEENVHGNIRI